jgi:hypothetical protein
MSVLMNPNLVFNHTYDVIEVEQITTELIEFLNKTFGPPGPRWWISNYKIYFRDERDYIWFELAT